MYMKATTEKEWRILPALIREDCRQPKTVSMNDKKGIR